MRPRRALVFPIVLSLLGLLGLSGCGQDRGPRLVLLLIVDTLRADRLGCYGYRDIETPHLDRLAETGTLYLQAMTAAPITLPSVSTILTGAYPLQHGVRDNGVFALGESWETLAEKLRAEGFRTGAFVSAAVLSSGQGVDQGFEIYDDDMSAPYVPHHPLMKGMDQRFQGVERRAALTVDRAIAWLEQQPDEDTFLMVHLFDPHLPRDPLPDFRDRYPDRLYDGEVAGVDHEIGRLFERIEETKPGSELLTVFVADHGEGLSDHEEDLHGVLLFEETVRVPLILAGPGIDKGRRIEETVRTADIPATICALLEIPPLSHSVGVPLPGITLPGGETTDARRDRFASLAYLETFRSRLSHGWCELRALRTPRWKLIAGPKLELYDLASDPEERVDLSASMPAVRDSLAMLMDVVALQSLARGRQSAEEHSLSQQEREQLLSLGYVTPGEAAPPQTDSLAIWYFPPEERGPALGLADPRERLGAYNERVRARSYAGAGTTSLARGDLAGAEERFRSALHFDPAQVEAHLGLAEVFERRGQHDRAILVLRHASEQNPEDSTVALTLSRALAARGDSREALVVLQQAIHEGVRSQSLLSLRDSLRAAGPRTD